MGEVGRYRRHAMERAIELATQWIGAERVAAFEEVGEHLAVIGRRALEMHAIGEDLAVEFAGEKPQPDAAPPLGVTPIEKGRSPDQRLDILDEVIAADIGLKIVLEKRELLCNRPVNVIEGLAARRHLLHENDDAD